MDENILYCNIILPNGSIITHVENTREGYYRSSYPLNREIFDFSIGDIVIEDEETNEIVTTLRNAKLGLFQLRGDGKSNLFSFEQIPLTELQYTQTRSDIEYIAMMTETEL